MSERPRALYERKYPALSQLLVEVLANQYFPDRLDRAVADHVDNTDAPELQATLRELDMLLSDSSMAYADLAKITNYDLKSTAEAHDMLAKLRQKLVDGMGSRPGR